METINWVVVHELVQTLGNFLIDNKMFQKVFLYCIFLFEGSFKNVCLYWICEFLAQLLVPFLCCVALVHGVPVGHYGLPGGQSVTSRSQDVI